MKKILFTISCIIMLGCSKKDTINRPALIVGKWYALNSTITDYKNGILVGSSDTTFSHADYIIFNSDGTGSHPMNTNPNVYTPPGMDYTNFKYTIKGNLLTITYPPYNPIDPNEANITTVTVEQLTSTSLKLHSEDGNGTESETIDWSYVK